MGVRCAHPLEIANEVLIGIKLRRIGRQEEEVNLRRADRFQRYQEFAIRPTIPPRVLFRSVPGWNEPGTRDGFQKMRITQLANLGTLSLDYIEIPPGYEKAPVVHYECQEVLFILNGVLKIQIGDEWRVVSTGDTVEIPIGTVHASRNDSQHTVTLLAANSPAYKDSFEHGVSG